MTGLFFVCKHMKVHNCFNKSFKKFQKVVDTQLKLLYNSLNSKGHTITANERQRKAK